MAFAFWSGFTALAGEKIKITGSDEKLELPKEKEILGTPGGFLPSRIGSPESGGGTVMPQANQPVLLRNPKLEESLDRKKNWLLDSPNNLERDETIKEIFGVRKYELNSLDKKPKSAFDRFYDSGKEGKSTLKGSRGSRDGSNRESLGTRNEFDPSKPLGSDEPDKAEHGGVIQELNPAQLFNWSSPSDSLSQVGGMFKQNSILPRSIGDQSLGQPLSSGPGREINSPANDLRRTWDFRSAPGTRFADPINDSVDTTRSPMNPIAARRPSVPPPQSSEGSFGGSFSFGSSAPISARPDFFSSGRDRSPSASFTTPTPTPVSAPAFQPKPGVLEIPRPKF